MDGRGSKRKGNKFENDVLRQVRKLDAMAHKTLGSGNSKDDKGDLAFLDYLAECKHHKTLTNSEIDKYWEKINKEAEYHNKIPLLIFKENRKKPIVMFWIPVKSKEGIIDHMRGMMLWEEFLMKEEIQRGIEYERT